MENKTVPIDKLVGIIKIAKKRWVSEHKGHQPVYLHLGWQTANRLEEKYGDGVQEGMLLFSMKIVIHSSQAYRLDVSDTQ